MEHVGAELPQLRDKTPQKLAEIPATSLTQVANIDARVPKFLFELSATVESKNSNVIPPGFQALRQGDELALGPTTVETSN